MSVETFIPAISTHVEEATWDDESEDLIITFDGGDQYMYRNVPKATWKAFMLAPSQGAFVHRQLKGRFFAERV